MPRDPMEPLISPPEDVRIFRALKLAHHTGRALMDAEIALLGLTVQQLMALTSIAKAPSKTSAELARENFISPQAMNRIVARLEERGLLHRVPRRSSGRSLDMRLTARGEALLARALTCARAVERRAYDIIGHRDFEALMRGLHVWTDEMSKGLRSPHLVKGGGAKQSEHGVIASRKQSRKATS
jgi:DNA-binding MarR family transcriptional regulator